MFIFVITHNVVVDPVKVVKIQLITTWMLFNYRRAVLLLTL